MKKNEEKLLKEMKREAEERLKCLGLGYVVERPFKLDKTLMCSDNSHLCVRTLSFWEFYFIQEWEKEHKSMAYHIVYNKTVYG